MKPLCRRALVKEKDFNRLERANQALDVLAVRAGNAFKVIAGDAADAVNKLIDALEKGDGFFQRYQRYAEARYLADDPDFKKKEAAIIEKNEADKEAIFDFFTSPFAGLGGKLGATGDEAAFRAQQDAAAARRAEQDKRMSRIPAIREQWLRHSAAGSPRAGRLKDELDYAQEERRRIHRGRMDAERPTYPYAGDDSDARIPPPKVLREKPAPNIPLPPPRPMDITGQIDAVVQQPVPVDVTGKVEAEVTGAATVSVRVAVEGGGRVTGMSAESSGHIKANVGASMPHIKAGPR
jgi:hypothetical protein